MSKTIKYDVCIVGSGAGAGPVIYELSKVGLKILVLEKGPWFRTEDFSKDELVAARRSVYTPNLKDEKHVIATTNEEGQIESHSTEEKGSDFWNGNCVGGSSNFMSGYFNRLKPNDFKLKSVYGTIENANIVDWPISYTDLEPYYAKVEQVVGISGKVVEHKFQEPRSTADFPYPPLSENIISSWLDSAGEKLNYKMLPIPRAIISKPKDDRDACYYSNYCGSYGCSSNAKSSSRVALIHDALKTGNCTIIPNAKVYHLETDGNSKITKAHYYDVDDKKQHIKASLFVVAAQAIETSRLLLMSKNEEFPNGLANNTNQVGKNLIFSAGGTGGGLLYYKDLSNNDADELKKPGVFVNRSLQDFYEIEEKGKKLKGGTIDFLFEHANPILKALHQKWDTDGNLVYGSRLKQQLKHYFKDLRKINFEIFIDWLANDGCFVTLDKTVKDKWGDPVAKVQIDGHEHNIKIGKLLADKATEVLEKLGAKHISSSVNNSPPTNLQGGGCRFGNNPNTSVLDKNCKAHEVKNLYISDGSFMPTGGSVTYTWTIYANAFRVAEAIKRDFFKLNTTNKLNLNNALVLGKFSYTKNKDFIKVNPEFTSKTIYLRKETNSAFEKMQEAAKKDKIKLTIISGTRTFYQQKAIWERKWLQLNHLKAKERALEILNYSAMPCTSRHHWGADIDINQLDNHYFESGKGLKEYQWLQKNASKYGFHQVYNSKNTGRTGYNEEKWHWSYLAIANQYLDFYNHNIHYSDIKGFEGSSVAAVIKVIANYVNGISTK
jgi:choline dehydrogenase-like flavoprotein